MKEFGLPKEDSEGRIYIPLRGTGADDFEQARRELDNLKAGFLKADWEIEDEKRQHWSGTICINKSDFIKNCDDIYDKLISLGWEFNRDYWEKKAGIDDFESVSREMWRKIVEKEMNNTTKGD